MTCFGNREFTLAELYGTLSERISGGDTSSYTCRLAHDERKLMQKVLEEAREVSEYTDRENLVWEIADVAYHLLVLMAKKGIEPDEIVKELRGRRR